MELFGAEQSTGAHPRVEPNSDNRWLTESEVQSGRTSDGQPVSATMRGLLEAMLSAQKS
jgi:hypothetical protein